MRSASTVGWYVRMRSMSCSAWSIQGSATRSARVSRVSAWRGPTEKSNTASAMRQLADPSSATTASTTATSASVYVHFPYCLAKCPYCDFTSYATNRGAIDHAGYADTVLRELDRRAPSVAGRRIETVFFGGG